MNDELEIMLDDDDLMPYEDLQALVVELRERVIELERELWKLKRTVEGKGSHEAGVRKFVTPPARQERML